MVVVVVDPWLQGQGALVVAGEHLPVGPFGLEGPVEAFHFAVLAWAVGSDADVVGVEAGKDGAELVALGIGPVVVGHHLLDAGDPVRGVELGGAGHEPSTRFTAFVRVDLAIGETGVVIDS